jgi:aquaporin Z
MTTLRKHLPEYLMEAGGLGLFMISASLFGTMLGHPHSPAHLAIPDPLSRRALMGLVMGLTAVCIIYSPWGRRSGAHINPATTLTFWRLGKVAGRDAVGYAAAQFLGGLAGMLLVGAALGKGFLEPPVSAVATLPGPAGTLVAFVAEVGISFVLMFTVLTVNNAPGLAPYTGVAVGTLVALYITFEAPLSGMSMNPARTFASAVASGQWTGLWLYFTAPLLGMLAAAEAYVRLRGVAKVRCAKLHHENAYRCIFCEFHAGKSNLEQVIEKHIGATTMLNTDLQIPAPGS